MAFLKLYHKTFSLLSWCFFDCSCYPLKILLISGCCFTQIVVTKAPKLIWLNKTKHIVYS